MKKAFLILIILTAGIFSLADEKISNQNTVEGEGNYLPAQFSTINNLDSVVFDLSLAVDTLNYVYFPVSILSDDSIYSLDFSFKYNNTKLIFDSIIDMTNYIQFLSYYNGADSTVRFTCNSLQRYTNDTALVWVRFITLGGPIIDSDLNTIDVYLNGMPCSLKFISSLIDETAELKNSPAKIIYYLNAVQDIMNIHSNQKASVLIYDLNGKLVYGNSEMIPGNLEIATGKMENGIYFLIIRSNLFLKREKFIINR